MPVDTAAPPEYESTAQIAIRGGYCRYYSFGFFTVGAEAAIRVGGNLHVLAGAELYAARQVYPPEVALETGIYAEWNQVLPVNVGVMYEFSQTAVQPYLGADLIGGLYTQGALAVGARARGGLDLMVSEGFGFNFNLAVGAWGGSKWEEVDSKVQNFGLLPQISAGTVIAF